MSIPEAAIEAAAEAVRRTSHWIEDNYPEDAARAAIQAAMPAIREALAQEVIRNGPVLNYELNYDGTEDKLRAAYVEAFRDASAIVRGGTL